MCRFEKLAFVSFCSHFRVVYELLMTKLGFQKIYIAYGFEKLDFISTLKPFWNYLRAPMTKFGYKI